MNIPPGARKRGFIIAAGVLVVLIVAGLTGLDRTGAGGAGLGFNPILPLAGLLIYFVPTAVAWHRKHRQIPSIAALNLFLGWTLIGWVAALCWALLREGGRPTPSP